MEQHGGSGWSNWEEAGTRVLCCMDEVGGCGARVVWGVSVEESRGEGARVSFFFFFLFFFSFVFFCNDIDGSVCFMWFQIINIVGKII